jgi:phosphoenolpyruvate-protein phosphotransferase (PTS system enzyme I)
VQPTTLSPRGEELVLVGIGVSPGIARGPIFISEKDFDVPEVKVIDETGSAGAEWARFEQGIAATRAELAVLRDEVCAAVGSSDAFIFDAHLMMLEDSAMLTEVRKRIEAKRECAEGAFYAVMQRYMSAMRNVDDAYLRERVADIEDVAQRVVRVLRGEKSAVSAATPHILLAHEISPSDTAAMDRRTVLGFATETGSHTSHSTIMARSMAIPAVVGLPEITLRFHEGQQALLDGTRGLLIIDPTEETLAKYVAIERQTAALDERLHEMVDLPAVTPDGQRMILAANIEFSEEVGQIRAHGAEGVGLYRTEFFYLNRPDLPNEDEQAKAYGRVAREAGPEGVIIRTLDIGGDKLHHIHQDMEEANPFLGWRGIRVSLGQPDVFKTQLRAVLRASAEGPVRIMFPMISGLEEVRAARAVVAECRAELAAEGYAMADHVPIGCMIEIPSAAVIADLLAREVDFFSLGTNDLIQYTIAVDRGNELVAGLYQPCHSGILRLIKMVVEAARGAKIWTGVCGEMAGDPLMTPLLVGLGVEELSMAAVQIPKVQLAVRRLPAAYCRELAAWALDCGEASKIAERCRAAAQTYYPELLA